MITKQKLREVLSYDKRTGLFNWLAYSNGRRKDLTAGSKNKDGYIVISIDNQRYYAHRLAMIYVNGFCGEEVDHIDGNTSNNSLDNLRDVNGKENSKNCSKPKSNKSGVIGVSFDSINRKWRSTIKVNYKQIHIGRFNSFDAAVKARKQAEQKYGFHENHGRSAV